MKRSILGLIAIFASVMPVSAQDSFKKFFLRFSGGYGIVSGGDIPRQRDGINTKMTDLAAVSEFAVTERLQQPGWGPESEAEFVWRLTRNFGVGLGAEYVRRMENSRAEIEQGSLARASFDWQPAYKAFPIKLSGYYFLPLASPWSVYARAGVGYYFGIMNHQTRKESDLLGVAIWEQNDSKANKSGFGFHGGLGMELHVTETVAFFAEGSGRYVNLKSWDVENAHSSNIGNSNGTGIFWLAEEHNDATGKFYATMKVSESMSSAIGLRNVREAAVSFSGFTFRVGMKISF